MAGQVDGGEPAQLAAESSPAGFSDSPDISPAELIDGDVQVETTDSDVSTFGFEMVNNFNFPQFSYDSGMMTEMFESRPNSSDENGRPTELAGPLHQLVSESQHQSRLHDQWELFRSTVADSSLNPNDRPISVRRLSAEENTPETNAELDGETEAEAEIEADVDAEADADADAEVETGAEADEEADSDDETDEETDVETDAFDQTSDAASIHAVSELGMDDMEEPPLDEQVRMSPASSMSWTALMDEPTPGRMEPVGPARPASWASGSETDASSRNALLAGRADSSDSDSEPGHSAGSHHSADDAHNFAHAQFSDSDSDFDPDLFPSSPRAAVPDFNLPPTLDPISVHGRLAHPIVNPSLCEKMAGPGFDPATEAAVLSYPVSKRFYSAASRLSLNLLFVGRFQVWSADYQNIARTLDYAVQCVGTNNQRIPHPAVSGRFDHSMYSQYVIHCDFFPTSAGLSGSSIDSIHRVTLGYVNAADPIGRFEVIGRDSWLLDPANPEVDRRHYDVAVGSPSIPPSGRHVQLRQLCSHFAVPLLNLSLEPAGQTRTTPEVNDIRVLIRSRAVRESPGEYGYVNDDDFDPSAGWTIGPTGLASVPAVGLNHHLMYLHSPPQHRIVEQIIDLSAWPLAILRIIPAILCLASMAVFSLLAIVYDKYLSMVSFIMAVLRACQPAHGPIPGLAATRHLDYHISSLYVGVAAFAGAVFYVTTVPTQISYLNINLNLQVIPTVEGRLPLPARCPPGSLSAELGMCSSRLPELGQAYTDRLRASNLTMVISDFVDRQISWPSRSGWSAHALSSQTFLLVAPEENRSRSTTVLKLFSGPPSDRTECSSTEGNNNPTEPLRHGSSFHAVDFSILPVFRRLYAISVKAANEGHQVMAVIRTIQDPDTEQSVLVDLRSDVELNRLVQSGCRTCKDLGWVFSSLRGRFDNLSAGETRSMWSKFTLHTKVNKWARSLWQSQTQAEAPKKSAFAATFDRLAAKFSSRPSRARIGWKHIGVLRQKASQMAVKAQTQTAGIRRWADTVVQSTGWAKCSGSQCPSAIQRASRNARRILGWNA